MSTHADGFYKISGEEAKFVFANNNGEVATPLDAVTNLPTVMMFRDVNVSADKLEQAMYSCVVKETNQNITPLAKETL